MRIAVLGLGRMGQAIAGRLLDGGHAVTVWNRSADKEKGLVGRGAVPAGTIQNAVAGADVVLTSLANDQAVRDVALGDDGIRTNVGDSVYVEMSTVSPALAGTLADAFERFASMPVAGSPAAVGDGKAVLLLGCDDGTADRLEPVTSSLSETLHRFPSPALAAVAKLTVNALLLSGVAALSEALAVGRAGGLADDQLRGLLAESPMVAPGLRNRFDAVLTGSGSSWWTVDLGAKDVALALEVAEGSGRKVPLLDAVLERYRAASDDGLGGDDIAAVTRLYRS